MTTIILTIIGILLAAAAALMVIFYGGDAFNSGSVGAQANTYQNAGTNVIAAVQLYKADGNSVAPTTELLKSGVNGSGSYLKEDAALPSGAVGVINAAGTTYTVATVEAPVCVRINKNLKLAAADLDSETGFATTQSKHKMSCGAAGFVANL